MRMPINLLPRCDVVECWIRLLSGAEGTSRKQSFARVNMRLENTYKAWAWECALLSQPLL